MPVTKQLPYNIRKKTKKVKSESDSSSSSSSSEEDSCSDSEYNPSSSNPNDDEEEDTVYTEYVSGEEKEEFDPKSFRKTIAKMFPSNYSKERAKDSPKKKKNSALKKRPKYSSDLDENDSEDDSRTNCDFSESEVDSRKKSPKKSKKEKGKGKEKEKEKNKKRRTLDSDDLFESDSEYNTDDAENEEGKFLILSVGGVNEDVSEVDSLSDDPLEEFDSDAEKTFMGEAYETLDDKPKQILLPPSSPNKKSSKKSKKTTPKKDEDLIPIPTNVENEYKEMIEVRKILTDQLKRRPKNKFLKNSLKECNSNIKKLTRKARHENTNAYYKLVNSDKRQTDEIDYFKHRLSNKDQQEIMNDLKEINRSIYVEKPYRLSILQSSIPAKFKTLAIQRLNTLISMDPSDHEYYKIKNWVDAFMKIPFGIYRNINVRMSDGIDVCNDFMESAKRTLDNCVYGLNDAKLQIMQMLGQWIVNPNSVGTSIAIHGPPGTGKTSIVKEGISKILGREFAFIALGGCGDGSFLEGHSYTYEGSMWGRIVQILMDCKSMNPIIYFDELDKVSDTPRGQEIIGILTHLTDTSQNSEFHDKYFSEVSLDLSKCLFIFSYNDEHAVNPILKDRMYRIQTKGYDTKEKITIARDFLVPKIREQVSFSIDDIIIPDETLHYIISTPHLTKNESGVRNLKRCLEIIYTKLNLYRLVKPGNPMFEKDLGVKVQFPMTVTRKEVDVFIKNNETLNPSILAMYV
jgi:hypothetical protein